MKKNKPSYGSTVFDGLLNKNPLLVSGMVIAPIVACCDTLMSAFAVSSAFTAITLLTILISTFIPRQIVFSVRIILYTIIASIVYVPVVTVLKQSFGETIDAIGIFIPMLVTNSMITLQSEILFFKMPRARMLISVPCYLFGFDAAALVFGMIRELICYGTIGGRMLFADLSVPAVSLPCAGFILLGLMSAFFRKLLSVFGSGDSPQNDPKEDEK